MKNRTPIITLLAACVPGLLACERISDKFAEYRGARTEPVSTPSVEAYPIASARPPAVQVAARNAAASIAESRCQREAACDNVGDSKKYSSNQDCLDSIRASWKDELSARECPSGVNDAQLDECLTKIRTESCNSPLDSLARLVECRSGQVCQT